MYSNALNPICGSAAATVAISNLNPVLVWYRAAAGIAVAVTAQRYASRWCSGEVTALHPTGSVFDFGLGQYRRLTFSRLSHGKADLLCKLAMNGQNFSSIDFPSRRRNFGLFYVKARQWLDLAPRALLDGAALSERLGGQKGLKLFFRCDSPRPSWAFTFGFSERTSLPLPTSTIYKLLKVIKKSAFKY